MDSKVEYSFKATIWSHDAGWHFATLPMEMSEEIRLFYGSMEEGWGRLKAVAQINDVQWKTSIWFDTEAKTYLLPIKKEIRVKLWGDSGYNSRDEIEFTIKL